METKYESTPEAISELALGGVLLDRREMLIAFALECFRQGMLAGEIRSALVNYIRAKKWPWYELDARLGIVEVALTRYRKERPDLFAAAAILDEPRELLVESLSEDAPESLQWLWPQRIAVGKVTVVYGEAGIGKTCWSLDLAARVSAGSSWPQPPKTVQVSPPGPPPGPQSRPQPGPGRVLLLNGQDHQAHTIRPRLAGSGAKLENIKIIAGLKSGSQVGTASPQRSFDLGREIPALKQQIKTLGDVRLVIIDPLEAYCTAGQRTQKMRTLMESLEQLAEECDVAVVVISGRTRCDLPVQNVWRVDCDLLQPEVRWWVPVRCHWQPLPPWMAFWVNDRGIEWDPRRYPIRETQLQSCPAKLHSEWRSRDINRFLFLTLAEGPQPAKALLEEGARRGWSASQIKRAKEPLFVRSFRKGGADGEWFWELSGDSLRSRTSPSEPPYPIEEAQFNPPATQRPVAPPVPAAVATPPAPPAALPPSHFVRDVWGTAPQPTVQPRVTAASGNNNAKQPVPTAAQLKDRLRQWDQASQRECGLIAKFD